MPDKLAEVRRILDRYLVEVVEEYGLCPWARPARLGGELGIAILLGTPTPEDLIAAARAELAHPHVRVAMVVMPELEVTPAELRVLRDQLAAAVPGNGIAHFHPDAPLDLATPARLVPYLRRSPDPLLQLVPLALLDGVRGPSPMTTLVAQAQLLNGQLPPLRGDAADLIAATNHETVAADPSAIESTLADIAADRRASYARAGISTSR